jgi:hypothetical protein
MRNATSHANHVVSGLHAVFPRFNLARHALVLGWAREKAGLEEIKAPSPVDWLKILSPDQGVWRYQERGDEKKSTDPPDPKSCRICAFFRTVYRAVHASGVNVAFAGSFLKCVLVTNGPLKLAGSTTSVLTRNIVSPFGSFITSNHSVTTVFAL